MIRDYDAPSAAVMEGLHSIKSQPSLHTGGDSLGLGVHVRRTTAVKLEWMQLWQKLTRVGPRDGNQHTGMRRQRPAGHVGGQGFDKTRCEG